MIRTRDFLLYTSALLFLLVGITGTVVHDSFNISEATDEIVHINFGDAKTPIAVLNSEEENRSVYIASLKEKIANGDGQIIAGAAVFSSVDNVTAEEEEQKEITNRTVQLCVPQSDFGTVAILWPKKIEIKEVEGARMVSYEKREAITVGSTTKESVVQQPLIYFPITPMIASHRTCISEEIVGITLAGRLVANSDAKKFNGASESERIGYALDGFPIYGYKEDESFLDNCGGVNEGLGYRYYLRTSEPFVLGCYSAIPAKFMAQ